MWQREISLKGDGGHAESIHVVVKEQLISFFACDGKERGTRELWAQKHVLLVRTCSISPGFVILMQDQKQRLMGRTPLEGATTRPGAYSTSEVRREQSRLGGMQHAGHLFLILCCMRALWKRPDICEYIRHLPHNVLQAAASKFILSPRGQLLLSQQRQAPLRKCLQYLGGRGGLSTLAYLAISSGAQLSIGRDTMHNGLRWIDE